MEADMFDIEFREGYAAFVEWLDKGGEKPRNPYDEDAQPVEHVSWDRGFERGMEDS